MRTSVPVFDFAFAALGLAIEANAVIALRMSGFASGTATRGEAARMQSEKASAWIEAGHAAAAATLSGHPERAPTAAMAVYGRMARANRRRLLRK